MDILEVAKSNDTCFSCLNSSSFFLNEKTRQCWLTRMLTKWSLPAWLEQREVYKAERWFEHIAYESKSLTYSSILKHTANSAFSETIEMKFKIGTALQASHHARKWEVSPSYTANGLKLGVISEINLAKTHMRHLFIFSGLLRYFKLWHNRDVFLLDNCEIAEFS